MKPYYSDSHAEIWHGDCRDILPHIGLVDAVVTDPPYGLGFMGKDWDHGVPGVEFWRLISDAMKPGAHLVAFGGTRTHHRLMCGIEDAGFEIRDCLMWLYGSGFPKSLDVSKAIDKQRDDYEARCRVARWLRPFIEAGGFAEVSEAFGFKDQTMVRARWTSRSQPNTPTLEQWARLKEICALPDEMDAEVWRLNGRKGQPGEAWFEREVVGAVELGRLHSGIVAAGRGQLDSRVVDLTAPATDAAKQWDGWGTALKPAWEMIIGAQKPYDWRGVVGITAHTIMEALCQSPSCAKDAGILSALSRSECGEECDSALWPAVERCSTPGDLSALMATWPSGSVIPTSLSIVCSWLNTLGALLKHGSTFTTETVTGLTTDLRTLNSSPSAITPATIIEAATPRHGTELNASLAESTFSAVAARLRLTLARSAHENATGREPTLHPDAIGDLAPALEPIILARKPLTGTVAQNVLEYGTGALNIEACRVGTDVGGWGGGGSALYEGGLSRTGGKARPVTGRWPANLILDDESAVLLDEQSGESVSHASGRNTDESSTRTYGWAKGGIYKSGIHFGDGGGASRFFYTAKASRADRGEGNDHPTVKPSDLIKWLIRLITPPGGIVLDPFMGSGTTLYSAKELEFRAIGIELEESHCETAIRRLAQEVLELGA